MDPTSTPPQVHPLSVYNAHLLALLVKSTNLTTKIALIAHLISSFPPQKKNVFLVMRG